MDFSMSNLLLNKSFSLIQRRKNSSMNWKAHYFFSFYYLILIFSYSSLLFIYFLLPYYKEQLNIQFVKEFMGERLLLNEETILEDFCSFEQKIKFKKRNK